MPERRSGISSVFLGSYKFRVSVISPLPSGAVSLSFSEDTGFLDH